MVIKAEGILKFEIGKLVISAEVRKQILADPEFHRFVADSLTRYINCDWGCMPTNEKTANDKALKSGGRLIGSYKRIDNREMWIYTEGDRSITTILFREEY